MKVSRKSWHFRMYRFLISMWSEGPMVFEGRRTLHEPRDLCHYFWTIVVMVLSIVVYIPVATVVMIVFLAFYAAVWTYETFFKEGHDRRKAAAKRRRALAREEAGKAPKEPGLIKSYVLARKQKVCPVVEMVD